MRADLAAPLSSRLAKALCYGVRSGGITGTEYDTRKDEIEDFRKISYDVTNATIKETLDTAWGEWAATEPEMPLLAEKRGESLRALSRLPLFRKPPYVCSILPPKWATHILVGITPSSSIR